MVAGSQSPLYSFHLIAPLSLRAKNSAHPSTTES
ncbi:hypothetical protein DM49_2248 [Burkholderia mallei]|nr:hypothetical protein DM46_1595 [Burkholderia mallei]KOS95811.1 hypothetical protein DM49_2248 [Burkholderia mallei]